MVGTSRRHVALLLGLGVMCSRGASAQPALPPLALVESLVVQLDSGTWQPPPYQGQAYANTYSNALYIAVMNSGGIPSLTASAQRFYDGTPVCPGTQPCPGFRCGARVLPCCCGWLELVTQALLARLLLRLLRNVPEWRWTSSAAAADYKIGRTPDTRNGDGFSRLDTTTPTGLAAFNLISKLAAGQTLIPRQQA